MLLFMVSTKSIAENNYNKFCFLTSKARIPVYLCEYQGTPRFISIDEFETPETIWEITSGTLCVTAGETSEEFTTYEIQTWSKRESESQKITYSERWDIPLIISKKDRIKNREESLELGIKAACLNFASQTAMSFTLDKKTNKGIIHTRKWESGKCFDSPVYDQKFEVNCKKVN